MMKIAVITDVHANLPALQAVLRAIEQEGYDLLVHLGDAVAIGPFPAECLEVLLNVPNTQFVMGNHDEWLAYGLPQPQPEWMSDGEVAHQQWTQGQVTGVMKTTVTPSNCALYPMMMNLWRKPLPTDKCQRKNFCGKFSLEDGFRD
ncbi:MAG: metallophosphoesterase [Ardenticatenaceae bacterium]|nr:metallophosphoesterase [Ardenticatenaceae bacterium]